MKLTAIIQARMTSTRLPGKVLKRIIDRPLLSHMIERVQDANSVDRIIIATTDNKTDDPIVQLAKECGVSVFRGSEKNVLGRYYHAADTYQLKHIMRLTSDCPLIDPEILDELANYYFDGGFDYASNCLEPTLPDGLDAEIFSFDTLKTMHASAILPSHREHVTLYLYDNKTKFKLGAWKYQQDLSKFRLTVDHIEDLMLVRAIYEALYRQGKPKFRLRDIMQVLKDTPDLMKINAAIQRNEGLLTSKKEDEAYQDSKQEGADGP